LKTEEILERLAPMMKSEGLEFEVISQEGSNLNVRAKRVGPGIPVAFFLKAVAGTFRRYHEEITEIILEEYDAGSVVYPKVSPNQEFDKVLNHGRPAVPGRLEILPALDLTDCDRVSAVRALESAHKLWSQQGHLKFAVRGLGNPDVMRAYEKWSSFYGCVDWKAEHDDYSLIGLTSCPAPSLSDFPNSKSLMWMPAKIILVNGPQPEE
jgi:hypothetical protein